MSEHEYHLFRAKFIKPMYVHLYNPSAIPSEIFKASILECPEYPVNESTIWHIGNVQSISETKGIFAVGKTTKRTAEKYDDQSKSFYLADEESSPYTSVVFDSNLGLLAIRKKTQLAANTKAIAQKLKSLFMNASIVKDLSVEVLVEHIPDPTDFITKINSAYSITYFKSTFTGPNPVDADKVFQKPLSVYCQTIGGENGTIAVFGRSLSAEVVEAVAHSSAATANSATAKVKQFATSKPVKISFKGDPTRMVANSDIAPFDLAELMESAYRRVKGD